MYEDVAVQGPCLAVEGGVLVAEAAEVKERLHHRLLRGLISLLQRELVPVYAARIVVPVRRLRRKITAENASAERTQ